MSEDAFENVDDIVTKREMKIPLGIVIEKRNPNTHGAIGYGRLLRSFQGLLSSMIG